MKTPITETSIVRVFEIPANQPGGSLAPARHRLYVRPEVCRRLELDRAALIEALERLLRDAVPVAADIRGSFNVVEMSHAEWDEAAAATNHATDTLAAARANFPTS
jgi:hypothetical protein